jgi:hypothetical protein
MEVAARSRLWSRIVGGPMTKVSVTSLVYLVVSPYVADNRYPTTLPTHVYEQSSPLRSRLR